MNPQQIRDTYDRHAPRYDSTSEVFDRFVTRELRRGFGGSLHGVVLEAALGTGRNLPWYSPAVTRAVGVDLSAGMLKRAAQRAGTLSFPVDLVEMNVERLAFADHVFDCVAICEALCTTPHPERALAELHRVCRPDGTAVFLEHVRSGHWPVYQMQRLVTPFTERSIGCHWTRDTIAAIRDAGFEVRQDKSRLLGVFHLVVAKAI